MATALENLKTARDNVAQTLATVTNPTTMKPSYSLDGQSVQWADYVKMLLEAKDQLDKLIVAQEPYSYRSQVM